MSKKTKIIATIGPASDSVAMIKKLRNRGMDVARLNFSHGTYEYFEEVIRRIREVDETITILLDTKGPEIRTSKVEKEIVLKYNQKISISNNTEEFSTQELIQVDYKHLFEIAAKNMILIDDGSIAIEVTSVDTKNKVVRGVVKSPGKLNSNKTVSIHGHSVKIPFLSQKDKSDIEFGIKQGVDVVAASFVRSRDEVVSLKEFISSHGGDGIKVISKIEHGKALDEIEEIIQESFGIMVARGDLGVEIPIEKVPFVQEQIIALCNEYGKPVIVATQMLESMKESKVPTRAEVNDVAQAILQGADCVMLSGETAGGKYPEYALEMMNTICLEYDSRVESYIVGSMHSSDDMIQKHRKKSSLFITKSAYYAAKELEADAIIIPTESGYSARKISRFKPQCSIIAVCRDMRVLRQIVMSWGVSVYHHKDLYKDHDSMVNVVVDQLYSQKLLKKQSQIVIASGKKVNTQGHTNTLEIYKVDEILKRIELKK
ncbi:MAG: pyruvate kinase [Candidatus Nanoarchaeia archaeon]